MNRIITTLAVTLLLANSTFAWYDYSKSGKGNKPSTGSNSLQAKAANCSPAIATRFLEFNNVSALLETGGSMWQDRNNNRAAYEIPQGSDEYLMYSGALWMGGKDVNNQLKLAGLTFRQGNDFWTGPLSVIAGTGDISQGTKDFGPAEIEPDVCGDYDKFYDITRKEVEEFVAWYACNTDPACNTSEDFPNYAIPSSILNWPAHGDPSRFQDFYLAPFKDFDGDGVYNPQNGDYPWYDLDNEVDCRTSRQVTLYGDFTRWWIFNDKGNVHTETQGDAIGMEIRAQAFAFATNDEINNMTFMNYEMVNRSTQRLQDTYFAVWADPDLGCSDNDYIGCDVSRGVGYAYNATNVDAPNNDPCTFPIGNNPPAIGIDFFEGPYQDNDGIANPLTSDIPTAIAQGGIPYSGLGIGYGDTIVDNERLGMKRFMYFDRTLPGNIYGDPTDFTEYYNYMLGIWRDLDPLVWGGTGHEGTAGATSIPSNYAFPADSDPLFWATGGVQATPNNWSELTNNNPIGDRRWVQAAGPFTLEPGALNNITVGVVYGRASDGVAWSSVEEMLKADDKAQALFDNCFRILNGPDAPDLTAQELDQEVILYLTNREGLSNNYNATPEDYKELDPIILSLNDPDTLLAGDTLNDPFYRFQGYQIFQIKNQDVGPEELMDTEKARLVAQCDVQDGVGQLINFPIDADLGFPVATEMVDGADQGIKHSFRVVEDAFATGTNKQLINHKKYYFMAIAYAYNNYAQYTLGGSGQQYPYLSGRKSAVGPITYVTVIPHNPAPELGGTEALSEYGFGPQITRLEGRGSGPANILHLTEESENAILNGKPLEVTYQNASGPINVKVIDPLNLVDGEYKLWFTENDYTTPINDSYELDEAWWYIVRNDGSSSDTIFSTNSIEIGNEQLIPEWGISVDIAQYFPDDISGQELTNLLEHTIAFADSSKQWLTGIPNVDGFDERNWIESGTANEDPDPDDTDCGNASEWNDQLGVDDQEVFESVLGGTWAPAKLVRNMDCYHMPFPDNWASVRGGVSLHDAGSIDIVITSDKSKWTRCVVLETQDDENLSWDGGTAKLEAKEMPSRDKNGLFSGQSGYNASEGDFNGAQPNGMSWFPGYVIDVSSGERLNMAFGEDSWLGNENGKDMLWNPSNRIETQFGEALLAGKHYVYVFRDTRDDASSSSTFSSGMPSYDQGQFLYDKLVAPTGNGAGVSDYLKVWRACSWVGQPALSETAVGLTDASDPYSFIETDVRISLRVGQMYQRHSRDDIYFNDAGLYGNSQNNWYNLYSFNMEGIATKTNDATALDSACQMINIVPNPYYAYSNYEFNRLENVVKIVNLPDQCTVRIYNTGGTLVRTFTKDSPVTSIDWDLKNHVGIPIASGMYIIHVEVPGGCERVMKWLGVVRPPDLENF